MSWRRMEASGGDRQNYRFQPQPWPAIILPSSPANVPKLLKQHELAISVKVGHEYYRRALNYPAGKVAVRAQSSGGGNL